MINYAFYCSFTDLVLFYFFDFLLLLSFDLIWLTGKLIAVLMLRVLKEDPFCSIIYVKREKGSAVAEFVLEFFCWTVNIILF